MAPPLLSPEERRSRRRKQSRRYNDRNSEARNEKTKIRMAKLRARDAVRPLEELAVRKAARQASDKKYREKHRALLALKARLDRRDRATEREEARAMQQAATELRQRRARATRACGRAIDKIIAAADAAAPYQGTLEPSADAVLASSLTA
ncbi:hypothetical protein B0H11DRAFT_2232990 [Mycena galericulata]|nr:hypothetical protein B0H11DRAFT_2232990 [Mycena galericulata]